MKLHKKHAPETDKYHPENLFKLNGEGLTWEEYKQNERGKIAPKIVGGTQLVWAFLKRYPKRSLASLFMVIGIDLFCIQIIDPLLSFGVLGVLAVSVFAFFYFGLSDGVFSSLCNALKQFASSNKSDSDNDIQNSNEFSVAGYIKDTGRKIENFYSELKYLEAQAEDYYDRKSWDMYVYYEDKAREMRLSLEDKRLPILLKKHDLVFVPATTQGETLELIAVTSENNAGQWDKNPRFRDKKTGYKRNIEGAVTYSATLDTTKLPDAITENTSKLCEFIAKPEVQETLTARMYVHQQASRVRGVADETLPDWTTSDSVLLDDYKRVKKWYINYRDTLTEKIYDLAQAHARDLRFETERKTSRRDAISAALSF
jgi:hypothetical protein